MDPTLQLPENSLYWQREAAHAKDDRIFAHVLWNSSECIRAAIVDVRSIWKTSDGFR
jgi:hypothetical protein